MAMKAAILCICLASCFSWAKTAGPRIHFREYRIGPVTYRGSFPFFDVWETMPDSLREILKRFPQVPGLSERHTVRQGLRIPGA